MVKDNKPAEAYASRGTDFKLTYKKGAEVMSEMNISVGGISKGDYPADNKNPVVTMRGGGAATKGTKCRGPMA